MLKVQFGYTYDIASSFRDHLTYDDERYGICPYAHIIRTEEVTIKESKQDREGKYTFFLFYSDYPIHN